MARCLWVLKLFVISIVAHGQDVYFSQFYNSPLTLNPALTGFFAEDIQVAVNWRDYSGGFIPSSTQAFSADMKLMPVRVSPDVFSVGLLVVSDNFLRGTVKRQTFLASGAYHYAFGNNNNHFLAAGIQLGAYQMYMDYESFSYDAQWVLPYGYNPDLPHNEDFTRERFLKLDWNVGALWYGRFSKEVAGLFGVSAFHVHEPRESFIGADDPFKRRVTLHGGPKFILREFNILPNIIVMFHNGSRQVAEGAVFEYKINESSNRAMLGAWYRHSDKSVIVSAGLRYMNFQFAVSSDFMSNLQKVSRTTSALEFSLIYTGAFRRTAGLSANPRNKY